MTVTPRGAATIWPVLPLIPVPPTATFTVAIFEAICALSALTPTVAGVNVTLIVHVDEAVNVAGQLFVCAKSVPVCIATLTVVQLAEPVFVTVMACCPLATLICWFPKEREIGEGETAQLEPRQKIATLPYPKKTLGPEERK